MSSNEERIRLVLQEDPDSADRKYKKSSAQWLSQRTGLLAIIALAVLGTFVLLGHSGVIHHRSKYRKNFKNSLFSIVDEKSPEEKRIELVKQIYRRPIKVAGVNDPLCNHLNEHVYTCSGYCPYLSLPPEAETMEDALVECKWLPRQINNDLKEGGMYCQIQYEDDCPDYNAFDKDRLPPTPYGVKQIPENLFANFTFNKRMPVIYEGYDYRGTSIEGEGGAYAAKLAKDKVHGISSVWDQAMIAQFIKLAEKRAPIGSYGTTALYAPMDEYKSVAIEGKITAVLGSERPWIEAMLLYYGAKEVTTIEYGEIDSKVPNLKTITPGKYEEYRKKLFEQGQEPQLFDSIWSYSSLEHDGLGRYGDPMNPYGDMQTMVKTSCMLKPGGFLFLAVPTQKFGEAISFNYHRIYGPIRWPYLYRHFHLIKMFGVYSDKNGGYNQPIWVFQNKIGCKSADV